MFYIVEGIRYWLQACVDLGEALRMFSPEVGTCWTFRQFFRRVVVIPTIPINFSTWWIADASTNIRKSYIFEQFWTCFETCLKMFINLFVKCSKGSWKKLIEANKISMYKFLCGLQGFLFFSVCSLIQRSFLIRFVIQK